MKKNNKNILFFFLLQISVIIFAFSGVFSKTASQYDFLSKEYIIYYGTSLLILGVYAILWQQIIKRVDISIAYTNKATVIFWSMLFAYLFFKETITIKNILGVCIIFIGILVVNKHE